MYDTPHHNNTLRHWGPLIIATFGDWLCSYFQEITTVNSNTLDIVGQGIQCHTCMYLNIIMSEWVLCSDSEGNITNSYLMSDAWCEFSFIREE